MWNKGWWVIAAVVVLAVSLAFVGVQASAASSVTSPPRVSETHGLSELVARGGTMSPGSASTRAGTMCSALTNGDNASGIYPATSKMGRLYQAYVEDWNSGNLTLCAHGHDSVIQVVPASVKSFGYYGLAGVMTPTGLDLMLLSWEADAGWVCYNATIHGCSSWTTFTLPASFCAGEPVGYCNPDGLIVGSNLAFTYVDVANEQMISCTALAGSCSIDAASSALTGFAPLGLIKHDDKLFVTDNSCTGNIWVGNERSLSIVESFGDALEAVTFVHGNLYVGDDAYCSGGAAGIFDVTTDTALPTPFTGPTELIGLDERLQFTSYTPGAVYTA